LFTVSAIGSSTEQFGYNEEHANQEHDKGYQFARRARDHVDDQVGQELQRIAGALPRFGDSAGIWR
jgi:hypothetical protein